MKHYQPRKTVHSHRRQAHTQNIRNLQATLKAPIPILAQSESMDNHATCIQVTPNFNYVAEVAGVTHADKAGYLGNICLKIDNSVMVSVSCMVFATEEECEHREWSDIRIDRILLAFLDIKAHVFNTRIDVAETAYDMLFNLCIAKSHDICYEDISLLDDLLYDCEQALLSKVKTVGFQSQTAMAF